MKTKMMMLKMMIDDEPRPEPTERSCHHVSVCQPNSTVPSYASCGLEHHSSVIKVRHSNTTITTYIAQLCYLTVANHNHQQKQKTMLCQRNAAISSVLFSSGEGLFGRKSDFISRQGSDPSQLVLKFLMLFFLFFKSVYKPN